MLKLGKAAVVTGAMALAIAVVGAILLASHPAQSKNDQQTTGDGVSTTLGF